MLIVIVHLNAATINLKRMDRFRKASMKFLYIKKNQKTVVPGYSTRKLL